RREGVGLLVRPRLGTGHARRGPQVPPMIAKTSGNGAAPASPPPRPEPVPTEPSGAGAARRPPAAAPGRRRRTPPPGRPTPPPPVPPAPSGGVAASRPPAAAPGRCRRTPPPGRRTPPRLIATAKAPSGNGGTWASPCSKAALPTPLSSAAARARAGIGPDGSAPRACPRCALRAARRVVAPDVGHPVVRSDRGGAEQRPVHPAGHRLVALGALRPAPALVAVPGPEPAGVGDTGGHRAPRFSGPRPLRGPPAPMPSAPEALPCRPGEGSSRCTARRTGLPPRE